MLSNGAVVVYGRHDEYVTTTGGTTGPLVVPLVVFVCCVLVRILRTTTVHSGICSLDEIKWEDG